MRLSGKVALITGGGTGIGRATALLFAREGARVLVAGRRREPLADVAREIGEESAAFRSVDVCDDGAVRGAVSVALDRFGRLDVLVNAAGQAANWTPVHETPDEAWDEVFDVNLKGAFRTARAALPHLVESRGNIVNVSSISAFKGSNSVASYAAAKAGLVALTRVIAAEYGWQGVRCNCIVPSWVETPMTAGYLQDAGVRDDVSRRHALQRVATPEEIARAVLYLASDDASFVTGSVHAVDGGLMAL